MPGASGRNGPPTVRDGEVCARPATPHGETAAKGEKVRILKALAAQICMFNFVGHTLKTQTYKLNI